jgi:thioredoxin reductase
MSRNLDRFKEPDETRVVAECAECHGEIYEGDYVLRIDDGGGFVHEGNCAEKYAVERVYDVEGTIDAHGRIN